MTDHEIDCYPLRRLLESHPDRPWHHMEFHWSPYVMPESKRIHIRSMNDRCPMQRTQGTKGIDANDRSRLDVLRKMSPSVLWIAVLVATRFLISHCIARPSNDRPMQSDNVIGLTASVSICVDTSYTHTHICIYNMENILHMYSYIYIYICNWCNWCISAWRSWFTW